MPKSESDAILVTPLVIEVTAGVDAAVVAAQYSACTLVVTLLIKEEHVVMACDALV